MRIITGFKLLTYTVLIFIFLFASCDRQLVLKTNKGPDKYGSTVDKEKAELLISDPIIFDFGTRIINSSIDKTFTISNNGTLASSTMSGSGLAAPFAFKGGGYPGTNGTCGNTLATSASCTIVVTYTPTTEVGHSDIIVLSYYDGVIDRTSTRQVTGTGAAMMGVFKEIGWDANPEHEILVGYKLYFGSAPGIYDGACVYGAETSPAIITIDSLTDQSHPSYIIDSFKNDTPCYFAISAYNNEVESSISSAIAFIP